MNLYPCACSNMFVKVVSQATDSLSFHVFRTSFDNSLRQGETPFNKGANMNKIDIGINEVDRNKITEGLCRLLADSHMLYMKTHNFHWNVEGPMFNTLHLMFMDQYTEMWNALDLIAERIRALGSYAPGSYKKYVQLSSIKESEENLPAKEMLHQLLLGHEALSKTIRSVYPAAEAGSDESTLDLLTQRLQIHEKTAWMLRSLLCE